MVKSRLTSAGFIEEQPHAIPDVFSAPDVGRFTGECVVGESRKADIVVRLWDGRVMPIECKVSNSQLNSIKRLTTPAAVLGNVRADNGAADGKAAVIRGNEKACINGRARGGHRRYSDGLPR